MEELNNGPEVIHVIMVDATSAMEINSPNKERKFKVQEIMLGAGVNRKSVPFTKSFLSVNTECRAEILENGKLRII